MAGEAAKIATALRKYGRTMKLRRRIGTTTSYNDVDVKGTDRGYKPDEIAGLLQQGDRRITISNAEIATTGWPGPPRKGDVLVVDGVSTAVQGSEAKYAATTVIAHVLWVRG